MMTVMLSGMPTAPDVRKLRKTITPVAGELIAYETLAAVLGYDRRSSRYRTVINAWRRTLFREEGVQMEAEHGQGLRVLTPTGAVAKAITGLHRCGRALKRVAVQVGAVDTAAMETHEKARTDLVRRTVFLVTASVEDARRAVAMPDTAHKPAISVTPPAGPGDPAERAP